MPHVQFTTSRKVAAEDGSAISTDSTEGQTNADERASAMRRFGVNGAPVQRHDLAANGQAEASSSTTRPGRSRLNELIEHRLALFIGDSRSIILDRHFRHAIRAGKRYADLTVFGRKPYCIAEDVPEHLG